jgi:cyanophycinase-like exopeptidase
VLILVAGASIFIESVEIQEQRNWSMGIGLVLITFMIVNGHNSLREFMGELLNGSLICKKENLNNLTVEDTKSLATYFVLRRARVRVPFKTAQNQLSPLTFGKLTNNPLIGSTPVAGISNYRDSQQALSLRGTRNAKMDTITVTSIGQTTATMT